MRAPHDSRGRVRWDLPDVEHPIERPLVPSRETVRSWVDGVRQSLDRYLELEPRLVDGTEPGAVEEEITAAERALLDDHRPLEQAHPARQALQRAREAMGELRRMFDLWRSEPWTAERLRDVAKASRMRLATQVLRRLA